MVNISDSLSRCVGQEQSCTRALQMHFCPHLVIFQGLHQQFFTLFTGFFHFLLFFSRRFFSFLPLKRLTFAVVSESHAHSQLSVPGRALKHDTETEKPPALLGMRASEGEVLTQGGGGGGGGRRTNSVPNTTDAFDAYMCKYSLFNKTSVSFNGAHYCTS